MTARHDTTDASLPPRGRAISLASLAPGGDVSLLFGLAENSPDGLLLVSPGGDILYTNLRFGELWRLPAEVIASGSDEQALAAALSQVVDPDGFLRRVREIYDGRQPSHEEILLVDGRILDRYGVPLHDAEERYAGYAWYFRDVTALKQAEAEQRALATTLQASLLPPLQPTIPGMDLATRYRPAASALAVGGDFFDVFRLGPNDWGVVVGDVCGKGARAAALTALTRYTLRAAAVHTFVPSRVLEELNAGLLAENVADADDHFCSVVFARLELDTCGAWVTLASAGHPRPVVVRAGGWLDVRGQVGNPVGIFPAPEVVDDRVALGPGDTLVVCTDGITEVRNRKGCMFGEEAFTSVLLQANAGDADALADRVIEEALTFADGRAHDDIALLVLRVPAGGGGNLVARLAAASGLAEDEVPVPTYRADEFLPELPPFPRDGYTLLPARPISVGAARRFLRAAMEAWGMRHLAGGDAEFLLSELVTNAVRYSSGAVRVAVHHDGRRLRVEVGDESQFLPELRDPGPEDTSGRGLLLVEALSAAWGVEPGADGKQVWFEIDAPPVLDAVIPG